MLSFIWREGGREGGFLALDRKHSRNETFDLRAPQTAIAPFRLTALSVFVFYIHSPIHMSNSSFEMERSDKGKALPTIPDRSMLSRQDDPLIDSHKMDTPLSLK